MAPPIYDGAPVVHKHYDPDGNLVGITEIASPWDEDARAEAEALYEADQLRCPMCGNLREDCGDPAAVWYPQRHVCYASRNKAAAEHAYADKHKSKPWSDGGERAWSEKRSPQTPFHFQDGVRIWTSRYDLTPDDLFI